MLTHLLLASLGLLAAATEPPAKPFDCGTDTAHAPDDFLQSIADLHNNAKTKRGSLAARAAALTARDTTTHPPVEIDAVFHIVAREDHKADITNDMPSAQLDTLNEAYKPYGFAFNLVNVTWTTNDAWATGEGDADVEMKKSLRQGTYSTLNIYFQTDLAGGVLGRCTLPSKTSNTNSNTGNSNTNSGSTGSPPIYFTDGCNVNANTMPSGALDGFNSGKTAVHETGHWLGLLHTFEGYSCTGPGDFIDDTPQESESTDGCPVDPPKSTCPDQEGEDKLDPIHNYMDYSIDECYRGFTVLQNGRMRDMWGLFREGR